MPHTGVNVEYNCLENGTLALIGPLEDVPICVPKTSCRLPDFPLAPATAQGYMHNSTSKGKHIRAMYYVYLNVR